MDEFGGWKEFSLSATGRFHIEAWNEGKWFVTPLGHPLIVVGVCHSQFGLKQQRVPTDLTEQKFGGDVVRYGKDVVNWMRRAGFNMFSYGVPQGAEEDMDRLGELNLIPGFHREPVFPDLFDPAWRAEAAAKIAHLVPEMSRDRRIIGYVLSVPLLFSPSMELSRIWRGGRIKRQNYLMAIKALPAGAPGKQAYVAYLHRIYGTYAEFARKRGPVAKATDFKDLLAVDLSASDSYETLHQDDAGFYRELWDDLTAYFVKEIRKYDPVGLIFSYRFSNVARWPDPWLEAMLQGVGPHVDAFVAELYGDNAYREAVDGVGRITGKPSLIGDGMRLTEFVYPDQADDHREAQDYARMLRSLLGSQWFLGGALCQYQQRLPEYGFYSPRPDQGRVGVRNPDYTERGPLLRTYKQLHFQKYHIRVQLLKQTPKHPSAPSHALNEAP